MKYILDAGHGGNDSGALSLDKTVKEKDLALKSSLRVLELLKPHLPQTSATRVTDVFLSLTARASKANAAKAKLVSIHYNAGGGQGIEVFTSKGTTNSDQLATDVINEMDAVSDQPMRLDLRDGDPDKEANFTVLVRADYEAILIEIGFMDNAKDLAYITDPTNFERICRGIARGLLRYAGLSVALIEPLDGGAPLPLIDPDKEVTEPSVAEPIAFAEVRERIEKAEWQLKEAKDLLSQ